MTIYIIYKTTNLINGKYYIGKHQIKNNNFDDGYLGSGYALNASIKKHGRENFKRETLYEFTNEESCFLKESELVNMNTVCDPLTYNMMTGGKGGGKKSKETKQKISNTLTGRAFTDQWRKNLSAGQRNRPAMSQETKDKIRIAAIGRERSKEHRSNLSKALRGRKLSEDHRAKCSAGRKGQPAHNKGVPSARWICEHCNKEGGGMSTYYRWHHDNCKLA